MSKKMKEYQGQLTIFDYLQSLNAIPVSSTRLIQGQIVYLVDKCDISRYEVHGIYSVDDEDCAVLISRDGKEPITCITIDEIGISLFESEEDAKNEVLKKLEECECILASDMKIKAFKAFTSQNEDGSLMTAFYCELTNGYVYYKDYYSIGHLLKCSAKEAEKMLLQDISSQDESQPSSIKPKLKNMYKVSPGMLLDWEYTENSTLCS